jgi:hypothetical protein
MACSSVRDVGWLAEILMEELSIRVSVLHVSGMLFCGFALLPPSKETIQPNSGVPCYLTALVIMSGKMCLTL